MHQIHVNDVAPWLRAHMETGSVKQTLKSLTRDVLSQNVCGVACSADFANADDRQEFLQKKNSVSRNKFLINNKSPQNSSLQCHSIKSTIHQCRFWQYNRACCVINCTII